MVISVKFGRTHISSLMIMIQYFTAVLVMIAVITYTHFTGNVRSSTIARVMMVLVFLFSFRAFPCSLMFLIVMAH